MAITKLTRTLDPQDIITFTSGNTTLRAVVQNMPEYDGPNRAGDKVFGSVTVQPLFDGSSNVQGDLHFVIEFDWEADVIAVEDKPTGFVNPA